MSSKHCRWVPIPTLPELGATVLVTVRAMFGGSGVEVGYLIKDDSGYYFQLHGGSYRRAYMEECEYKHWGQQYGPWVIAWMSIPEPYVP